MVLLATPPVESRLGWLLGTQNADGGWGYAAAKTSWLEPTVYGLRACEAWPSWAGVREGCVRAQRYIDGLQRQDGSWRACEGVPEPHWSGALWLGLASAAHQRPARWRAGMEWLVSQRGADGGWAGRIGTWLDPQAVEQDARWQGWPWLAGTSSWVEPTCHAILALSRVQSTRHGPKFTGRLDEGRRLLLDRRCRDGGWNYGNRRVRGHDLPGYSETTALALLALQSCGAGSLEASLARARRDWDNPALPRVGRLWTALALRKAGVSVQLNEAPAIDQTITVALELVAWSAGGFL